MATALANSTSSPTLSPNASVNQDTPPPNSPVISQKNCRLAPGKIEMDELASQRLPEPLSFRIYLPPCYDEAEDQSYPVLYLVHGQSYTDSQWDDLGVPKIADRLISTGEVAPFIVVMPRDRVWTEPTQDYFGQVVVQELVPWVDEHYRTLADRSHRAIGGLSRGAAWAAELGFSHWELFGAVGMHSGFVFHSDYPYVEQWLKSIPTDRLPRIFMDLGNGDREEITSAATWLESMLTRNSIPHEWHLFIGEHTDAYWGAHVEEYLRFYTQEWGGGNPAGNPFSAVSAGSGSLK